MALGVYEAAKKLLLRIPDDIDIMCFGDSDMSHLLSPALSCVTQPTHELGTTAVLTILDDIRAHEKNMEHHLVIPAGLTVRDTAKAPVQKKRATVVAN